ncbi:hypothetical protein HDU98_006263, partial [Podochytrium sp. JEL0797]
WGWVDVGFSHSADDYDRKPIVVDPITKDDAIEVMELRMAMKQEMLEMTQYRNGCEQGFGGPTVSNMQAGPPTPMASAGGKGLEIVGGSVAGRGLDKKGVVGIKKPEGVVRRDSIATRFHQLGISRGKTPPQQQEVGPSSLTAGKAIMKPAAPQISAVIPTQQSGVKKGDDARINGKNVKPNQSPRMWAWNDRPGTSSKPPSANEQTVNGKAGGKKTRSSF